MSQLTIVTGGAGIIGSHLVERLARSAQTVLVIERPGTDVDHLLAEVEVVFADIRDRNASATALKGGRWIYHLARCRNGPAYRYPDRRCRIT